MIQDPPGPREPYRRRKRAVDLVFTAAAGAVLAIPAGIIAVAVFLDVGKPIIFRQARPGLLGRPFTLLKFRTMSEKRDKAGEMCSDEERVTRFGRLLRRLSLDELPELINVVKGEMSLVGPRPLLMRYLPRYNAEQRRRHDVLPGITGWAQINGRNAITWDQKLALDVWYVDNRSFALDLRILAVTVLRVLKREGIDTSGYVSAPEFLGSGHDEHSLHECGPKV